MRSFRVVLIVFLGLIDSQGSPAQEPTGFDHLGLNVKRNATINSFEDMRGAIITIGGGASYEAQIYVQNLVYGVSGGKVIYAQLDGISEKGTKINTQAKKYVKILTKLDGIVGQTILIGDPPQELRVEKIRYGTDARGNLVVHELAGTLKDGQRLNTDEQCLLSVTASCQPDPTCPIFCAILIIQGIPILCSCPDCGLTEEGECNFTSLLQIAGLGCPSVPILSNVYAPVARPVTNEQQQCLVPALSRQGLALFAVGVILLYMITLRIRL